MRRVHDQRQRCNRIVREPHHGRPAGMRNRCSITAAAKRALAQPTRFHTAARAPARHATPTPCQNPEQAAARGVFYQREHPRTRPPRDPQRPRFCSSAPGTIPCQVKAARQSEGAELFIQQSSNHSVFFRRALRIPVLPRDRCDLREARAHVRAGRGVEFLGRAVDENFSIHADCSVPASAHTNPESRSVRRTARPASARPRRTLCRPARADQR